MESWHEMNSNDLRASRCVTLLLYLLERGDKRVSDVICDIEDYSELDNSDLATKTALADAEELAALGVRVSGSRPHVLSIASSPLADLSQLNDSSGIARIALVLTAIADDDEFVRAADLRRAIAKMLGRDIRPQQEAPGAKRTKDQARALREQERYLMAIEERRVSQIRYRDAQGRESVRVICPYGFFKNNGQLYLVANTLALNGEALNEAAMRTYRADRVLNFGEVTRADAKRFGRTFELPQDFDARDWRMFPFQIGETLGPVTFLVKPERWANVRDHIFGAPDRTWCVEEQPNGSFKLRFELCSSWEDAARWALGMDVVPLAPADALDAWRRLLGCATVERLLSEQLVRHEVERKQAGKSGRPPSAQKMGQLITLLGLFSEQGVSVSLGEIMQVLDVSRQEALGLVELLSQTRLGYGYVPITEGDEPHSWQLSEMSDYEGVRLRLSTREAAAVEEALESSGLMAELGEDYVRLKAAFWPLDTADASAGLTDAPGAALGARTDKSWAENVSLVMAAIDSESCLRFNYQGNNDDAPQMRRALPQTLYSHNGVLYAASYDVCRNGMRNFHLGRMSELVLEESTPQERAAAARAGEPAWFEDKPRVRLLFGDRRAASFFNWEGMTELQYDDPGKLLISVPVLEGEWILRHVVAWADVVQTDDPAFARRVAAYAKRLVS